MKQPTKEGKWQCATCGEINEKGTSLCKYYGENHLTKGVAPVTKEGMRERFEKYFGYETIQTDAGSLRIKSIDSKPFCRENILDFTEKEISLALLEKADEVSDTQVEKFIELISNITCEECHKKHSEKPVYEWETTIYLYQDLSGATRAWCKDHMSFKDGKPCYGAKSVTDIISKGK